MKEIVKGDYRFSVDVEATGDYYRGNALCDCAGCRNFYVQVNGECRILTEFLSEFGVNAARPDEIAWYEHDNEVLYEPMYTVNGRIAGRGTGDISAGSLRIVFSEDYIPSSQQSEYFVIRVFNIVFPWVTDNRQE